MTKQEMTVTRSRATMKPRVTDAELPWFSYGESGQVFLGIGDNSPSWTSDSWRSPVHELPYRIFSDPENTEDLPLDRLEPTTIDESRIDFEFVGGFSNNAMQVTWKEDDQDPLLWLALKTFTGIQVQYLTQGRQQPIMFGFAQNDAYCYCDYTPCKECVFRCKHGFVLYAYFQHSGLARISCNRIKEDHAGNNSRKTTPLSNSTDKPSA